MLSVTISFWLGLAAALLALLLAAVGTALTELTPGVLRKLEESDSALAEQFRDWLNKKDEFRVSIRILQLVSVLLVVYCALCYGAQTAVPGEDFKVVMTAMIIMTLVYVVISEGLGYDLSRLGNRFLLRIYMPLIVLAHFVTWPLAFPLVKWRRFISEYQERNNNGEEKATAADEIISLVEQDEELGDESGELEEDERRMIKGVFDLDETLVREIMTPRVDIQAVPENASVEDVKGLIATCGHTRIPVYRESIDNVVGVITAKDLMDDEKSQTVDSITDLASQPTYIPETKNIGDLLEDFQKDRTQFAVVVDEYGGIGGIVTLEDILEEIVGEIHDEYELAEDEATIRYLPDGSVIVNARTPIKDLNEELGIDIPHEEDFETLGGYVSYVLGRIPEKGEVLHTDFFVLEIMSADQRRILKAKLHKKDSVEDGEGEVKLKQSET